MTAYRLPVGVTPSSGSLKVTAETIPDALQREHALGQGHWGVLHVFEGSVTFIDMETNEKFLIVAPDLLVIPPPVPHRVEVKETLRCRIDFFRDLNPESTMRTPGAFADDAVRRSSTLELEAVRVPGGLGGGRF